MKTAIAIVLLLSFGARAADAGFDVLAVNRAVIDEQLPDGGVGGRHLVERGCWLSDAYCLGYAQELVDLRAQNKSLKTQSRDDPVAWLIAFAVVGGLLVGGVAGYALGVHGP